MSCTSHKQSLTKTSNWIIISCTSSDPSTPSGDLECFSTSAHLKKTTTTKNPSSVWSDSVSHLTWFYTHMQPIIEWAELNGSDVDSQHICFPLPFFFVFFSGHCVLWMLLYIHLANQIIFNRVSIMSSVLTGIARSTSGRLRRPERGEPTSPTTSGAGKCYC